jgi:hypothetical protein
MSALLSVLGLVLAFGVFMALIWSLYAVNRAAARRFGYEPFSLPNAALMLVANLLLLSALAPASDVPPADMLLRNQVMLGAAALLALGLFAVIARRVGSWYALYAVALMSVAAIAIFPSLLFMRFAAGSGGMEMDPVAQKSPESAPALGERGAPRKCRDKPSI